METGYASLTVYFEDPFWVGLFQRGDGNTWEACRIVFGPEPKDCQVYEYLLANYGRLAFSPSVEGEGPPAQAANPKRRQRQIKRRVEALETAGTKAQRALSLQREQGKAERRRRARENRDAERERQYALHREKRRNKHKGR